MQWVNKLNLKDVSLRKCSRIVRTSGSCNLTLAAATISDSGQFNLRISAFFASRQSESTKLIHCNALGTFSFFVLANEKWGHFSSENPPGIKNQQNLQKFCLHLTKVVSLWNPLHPSDSIQFSMSPKSNVSDFKLIESPALEIRSTGGSALQRAFGFYQKLAPSLSLSLFQVKTLMIQIQTKTHLRCTNRDFPMITPSK